MLILFRVWEQRRALFIYFLLIISPARCCAPVMRMRLKGKARQMDGPGHTAIFFRLDCLIRSLAAPSARTNRFTSNWGPMRDDLSWQRCWRRVGFVRRAADDRSGLRSEPIHHEDRRLLHIFSDYRFISVLAFFALLSACLRIVSTVWQCQSMQMALLINLSQRNIHIY